MNESEEKLFRQYEQQLDEHHESLPLWGRSRPEAIYALMTIPDAAFLIPVINPTPPVMIGGLAQVLKGTEEGVTQALRWLTSDGCTAVRGVPDHDLIEQAHRFAMYASDYVDIADFHMMLGRRWAEARVDAASRTVTFDAVRGPGRSEALASHEQVREQSNRGMDLALQMKPGDTDGSRRVFAAIDYELTDGRIQLREFPPDLLKLVRSTLQFTHELELVPLPPDTDMLGFTVREFWCFVDAVTAWSRAAFMRYLLCVRQGVAQHECMPTQIVAEQEFVDRVARLSQLPVDPVNAILDRLTYHPGCKADILLTPFLRGAKSVCWSPAVIMKYRHERNLLKVMSRGSTAMCNHSATVNGRRDRVLGRLIGMEFAKHGYQFKLNTPINANDEATDVDVLVYRTKRPDEVLIVEAKALIAPDEISEVHDATQTLIHGQEQVRRAKRILNAIPLAEKRQKFKFVNWDKVTECYGVVVSSDSEPHSPIDPQEVPALTYSCLRWRFRRRDFRSPRRFWDACVQRPWLDSEAREGKGGHTDVKVGDLTYRLPVCAVDINIDKIGIDKLNQLMSSP